MTNPTPRWNPLLLDDLHDLLVDARCAVRDAGNDTPMTRYAIECLERAEKLVAELSLMELKQP